MDTLTRVYFRNNLIKKLCKEYYGDEFPLWITEEQMNEIVAEADEYLGINNKEES